MYEDFKMVGADLFNQGVVSSHGGNLSVRLGDRILITRRGSMLGHLKDDDIIETGLERNDSGIVLASTEIVVHRAIYLRTSALAVVHAHPVHAVACSLEADEIVPLDSEGSYMLHKVPVLAAEHTVGSSQVAEIVSEALTRYKIVMLRGHGCFSTGQLLEEAYQWVSTLEASSRIICIARASGIKIKEYRKASDSYAKW